MLNKIRVLYRFFQKELLKIESWVDYSVHRMNMKMNYFNLQYTLHNINIYFINVKLMKYVA